jgi:hypothetical protein
MLKDTEKEGYQRIPVLRIEINLIWKDNVVKSWIKNISRNRIMLL